MGSSMMSAPLRRATRSGEPNLQGLTSGKARPVSGRRECRARRRSACVSGTEPRDPCPVTRRSRRVTALAATRGLQQVSSAPGLP